MNTDYKKGFKDGIRCFAHWKDGVEYVGTTGKTLALALAEFEYLHTYRPPPTAPAVEALWKTQAEFYTLVEAYLCTPSTEPAIEDHYKALVAWFVRNKRPDDTEPRPVSPEQDNQPQFGQTPYQ